MAGEFNNIGKPITVRKPEVPALDERQAQIITKKAAQVAVAFGISKVKQKFYNLPDQQDDPDSQAIATSVDTGALIYDNVVFTEGSYIPLDGGEPIGYDELRVDTVLLEVSQTKNIVRTMLNGRDGTIKEYNSLGDYHITMRGALTSGQQDIYPEDQVNNLIAILEAPQSLEIQSDYLARFGIFDVVVDDYRLPQQEGYRDVQLFEVRLSQDIPAVLRANT